MTAEAQPPETEIRRRPRWPRWLAVGVILVAVALLVLWSQRKPLADNFIARELAKRGVQASYKITRIGFSTQRIENVVIGSPGDPDLRADWAEVQTRVGFFSVSVTGVRVGHVWMRARAKGGAVSFGQLDKLLPPPSGKPFAFPKLNADITDAQVRFETEQGLVALRLAGKGRLDDGFAGELAATSDRLDLAGCRVLTARAALHVRIVRASPSLRGPIGAGLAHCGETLLEAPGGVVDLTLSQAFDRWQGSAEQAGASVVALGAGTGANRVYGTVRFAGGAKGTTGTLDLTSGDFALQQAGGARVAGSEAAAHGRFALGGRADGFEGVVQARKLALDPAVLARLAGLGRAASGTPMGPFATQLGNALAATGKSLDIDARLSAAFAGAGGTITLAEVAAAAPNGARAVLLGGDGVRYSWPDKGLQLGGTLALSGGGLPEATLALAQAAPGAAITGTATVAPYAAGGARLELAPMTFSAAPGGETRFATNAVLSGPLGDGGRIERLSLPVEGRWDGRTLALNPRCGVLGFDRLASASLRLDRSRIGLCPVGGAWVTAGPNGLGGGARSRNVRLGGTLGESRILLTAAGLELRLGASGFTLDHVAAELGPADGPTRLAFARLDGKASGTALAGSFTGGEGKLRNVELLFSEANGHWRIAKNALRIENSLTVSDGLPERRFEPLVSKDVVLSYLDNRIALTGTLQTPGTGLPVAGVEIVHDLSSGAGQADLDIPGFTFTPDGAQPTELTPVTKGTVAELQGKIAGHGTIRWDAQGAVTSDGTFSTENLGLAATFGPVTGLTTKIHFTDLLNMVTAPGQLATIATVNPGVPVETGAIRFQLLGPQKIVVESGRWPFAGGELELDRTVLDFASADEKKLVFRVKGADAAKFLQQLQFENLNATGIFDGVLPILFDQSGGRIEGGFLAARGGGTIAYIGAVTEKDVGVWGNMAFQALKSLNYRSLYIGMNGPLTGEMVTQVRFAGVSQGEGTKSNFLIRRLIHLPFVFNVTIRAPFRQLIGSVQSYYDPSLLEENWRQLNAQQSNAAGEVIQPSESEKVP